MTNDDGVTCHESPRSELVMFHFAICFAILRSIIRKALSFFNSHCRSFCHFVNAFSPLPYSHLFTTYELPRSGQYSVVNCQRSVTVKFTLRRSFQSSRRVCPRRFVLQSLAGLSSQYLVWFPPNATKRQSDRAAYPSTRKPK